MWHLLIDQIVKKASNGLAVLKRAKALVQRGTIINMYTALLGYISTAVALYGVALANVSPKDYKSYKIVRILGCERAHFEILRPVNVIHKPSTEISYS